MGLVDGDEAHLHALHFVLENLRAEAFWRHVEQFVGAEDAVVEVFQNFVARLSRIDGRRLYAPFLQIGHLVFHQGDERRNHDGHPLKCQGRHLERDTLSAARWHQSERVVARRDALDDFRLNAAKVIVAPILLQNLVKPVHTR